MQFQWCQKCVSPKCCFKMSPLKCILCFSVLEKLNLIALHKLLLLTLQRFRFTTKSKEVNDNVNPISNILKNSDIQNIDKNETKLTMQTSSIQ